MPIITLLSFQFVIHFLTSHTTKITKYKIMQYYIHNVIQNTERTFLLKDESSGACGLGGKDLEERNNFSSTGRYVVYRVKLVACPPTL